jgi:hypothetical protein
MKLIIDPKSAYQFNIENSTDLMNSIHKEAYTNAGKRVAEIIHNSKRHIHDIRNAIEFPDNNYNNVISFMGDRGSGKSTAALSLASAIIEKSISFLPDSHHQETITSSKIVKLDVIDPSLFQDNDRLIEIIISKMFDRFMRKIESKTNELDNNVKRDIVTKFQEVYQNLKTVHSKKSEIFEKESIEVLRELANGGNLKKNFFFLVQKYLEFVGDKADYLLIIIDDFDLNVSGAYEMLEDIRQFLLQYNVIIFIACKIEQLYDSVEQNIRKTTESMLSLQGDNSNNSPEEMTAKYLLKLFPLNSRCYIKPLDFDSAKFSLFHKEQEILNDQVEKNILEKIYYSTGILFLSNPNKKHPLIPRNLREFIQFYIYIEDLYSQKLSKQEKLENFKNYFLNYWVNINLTKGFDKIISDLNRKSLPAKNKFIISKIIELVDPNFQSRERDRDRISDSELREILSVRNNEANVSIGDVLSILRFFGNDLYSEDKELLLFAIKTYYSIALTELYLNNDSQKLKVLISTNIYSKADRNLVSKLDLNDYWSFEFRHFKDVKTQEEFTAMEILASFIISLKKSATRDDLSIIYQIGENSAIRSSTDVVFSMLSYLMNIWLWDEQLKKFFGNDELSQFEVKLEKEQLIPCFSVDLMDRIIYDLQTQEIKKSYTDSYIEIIDFIIKRVKSVLESIDKEFNDYFLVDIFENSKFYKTFYSNFDSVGRQLKTLKIHSVSESTENLDLGDINRLKQIVAKSLNYYNARYFNYPEKASSQGAKQAMNNLIKDFIPYPVQFKELQRLRWDMNKDYVIALEKIKNYLIELTNLLAKNG